MDIRNTRSFKGLAADRLRQAPQEKKIVLIYSGITLGLALALTLARFLLALQIDQMGGLSNLGTRTVLSSIRDMLPLAQSLFIMCIELGYLAAMLRIARGQYASPNTLRLGFDRFWTLLRASLFLGLTYGGLLLLCVYIASMIFVSGPWGGDFMALMTPLMQQTSLLNPELVIDDALVSQAMSTMVPMFVIMALTALVLILPVFYRLRMVNYVIIDKPGLGALAAIRESRMMMRRNCLRLLKLDLSYWWYFLVMLLVTFVGNGDLYLPLLGVEVPLSEDAAFFGFYIAYLVLTLLVYCFLRNRMEVAYGAFYDSIKPQEPQDNGVVLGNIFQM